MVAIVIGDIVVVFIVARVNSHELVGFIPEMTGLTKRWIGISQLLLQRYVVVVVVAMIVAMVIVGITEPIGVLRNSRRSNGHI